MLLLSVVAVYIVFGISIGRILRIGRVLDKRRERHLRLRRRGFQFGWVARLRKKEEFDPLADIDPGLRAFMELEKRLREKREARQQAV